jgi:hypothetical protein
MPLPILTYDGAYAVATPSKGFKAFRCSLIASNTLSLNLDSKGFLVKSRCPSHEVFDAPA